jgi:hypothetical protein
MIKFIQDNYTWVFSGVGVPVLGFIFFIFRRKKKKEEKKDHVFETYNLGKINSLDEKAMSYIGRNENEDRQKSLTRILFIDDNHKDFKMVSILKKSGWINIKAVKDITDLDDSKAVEADFIFVDINGVGMTMFEDQGLGLASALKKKYPSKKIVLYSSETTGDRFHKALREVDACLPKNAEPYQFINLIESTSKKNT